MANIFLNYLKAACLSSQRLSRCGSQQDQGKHRHDNDAVVLNDHFAGLIQVVHDFLLFIERITSGCDKTGRVFFAPSVMGSKKPDLGLP